MDDDDDILAGRGQVYDIAEAAERGESMAKIGIFVPVYFREKTVRVALKSLVKTMASDGYKVEAVLVDNRSNDELRAYLLELAKHKGVIAMLLDSNVGKAKAITEAAKRYSGFDWFISCDSDILHLTPGWPGILVDCYRNIPRAGMVSVDYVRNANHPMPKQPLAMSIDVRGTRRVFHYGGQVAGGCFATAKEVWCAVGYRNQGVYGGVDGIFRQNVADSLKRKCGYVEGVMAEHLDDRTENEGYNKWKLSVQANIRKHSPKADPSVLGNKKGFWG
jgi:glycosyltransferase involved in cell wall biosynthesis